MSDPSQVNEHFLNRVIAAAETAEVEASEDIVTGSGIKLLAKGARIDAGSRERLLQHKLSKPLEHSVRVADGPGSGAIDEAVQVLLDRHPLIAALCGGASARMIRSELKDLPQSAPLASMFSVYASQGAHKLDHAVGVSLLSAALHHGLAPGRDRGLRTLSVAGLLHDVGDLYIDPAILAADARLGPGQWKHIAAHPVVGAHVLRNLPGAGPEVAEAVLHHHERLDGFGYPQGLRDSRVPLDGQVLGLAEMLMGLIESGPDAAERASVAIKLIPGEFHRPLVDQVARAARLSAAGAPDVEALQTSAMEELTDKVCGLGATLQRLRGMRAPVEQRIRTCSPALKTLLAHVLERCQRIHFAFSSTGLDTHAPQELLARLAAMGPQVHREVAVVLREVEWRLHELKREARLRAERLSVVEAALVRDLIERSKGCAAPAATAATSLDLTPERSVST
jgi:hypothetical protein